MEITVGINSYMTLDEADTILDEELFSDDEELLAWHSLSTDDKTKIIIKGTRKVEQLTFIGYKKETNSFQTLQWPRIIGCECLDCPQEVKLGILKQALRDKINAGKQDYKQMKQLADMGVKDYKVKDASISFGDKNYNILYNGIYEDIYQDCFNNWTY